ncbi:hypothetical protein P7C70_g8236, partial [Phenoliferia sp. Uapishka_3]
MNPSQQNTTNSSSFPPNWRSTHLADQLGSHRPVIFNTSTLYALLGTGNRINLKIITSTGVSGGTVHPDSPLSQPTREFQIRASMSDIRQMGDCYAGVRVLALDDPVRDEGEFNVDRELIDGVLIYLQGNTLPTRVRMLIYAENNASIPALHDKLAEHYTNPEFHFQFNLALYYEALEAQRKLLQRLEHPRAATWMALNPKLPISATTDPGSRLPPSKQLIPTGVVVQATHARGQQGPSPSPTSTDRSSSSGLLGPGSPVYAGTDKSTQGEKLTANQRRRRNRANRRTSSTASLVSTTSSSVSSSPLATTSPRTSQQTRVAKPVAVAARPPPSTSNTLATPTTSNKTPLPVTTSNVSPSPRLAVHTTTSHTPQTASNPAAPQKRQHSPPTSPHWNARGTQTLFRKNLPARQDDDWRAPAENGSFGSSATNGLGAPYEYASPEQLRAQPTPPPFSFDHIVQSRSRAIVFCPPPANSSTASTGSARSFQTTTTLRNTGTSSYVSSPASPSTTCANIVFGSSGASIPPTQSTPASQRPQAVPGTQVPSTPLRTGGNQLEIGQQRASAFVPNYSRSLAASSERQTTAGTSPARSLPVTGASSMPFYPTTFESIPNTVQANTLMDLEHGVDDCDDYPRLSDISEMEEGELVDTDGYTTVVNKRKSKRLAMLAKRARTSEDKREHSYIGKGKQRARYQGSTKSRSNSGELLNLPHDLELELSAPRPQK